MNQILIVFNHHQLALVVVEYRMCSVLYKNHVFLIYKRPHIYNLHQASNMVGTDLIRIGEIY